MTTIAEHPCAHCDRTGPARRLRRDYTEDGVVETWEGECEVHGVWVEAL